MVPTRILPSVLLAFLLCTCASAQNGETPKPARQERVDETTFPAQQEWLDKWENSLAYTLETLMLLEEKDLDYRPTEDQMTLREQFHHMAGNIYFLTGKFIHAPEGFDRKAITATFADDADKTELAATLTKAYFFGAKAARRLNEEAWNSSVPDFFAGPKSKRVVFNLLQDHATHHRAQTLVYLRLLGYTPPRYRGW
ncbi:DinB family protein [Lewinella sp. 4G2]|uniref:DinB family protein n=1 Tax=Lewinella sp. 4G2 TaxID=1803372 RepID=UPI0007B4F21C|nr:DinB family protein [Lewinella sp. 4G2]OAV45714.1 hypothetical protein A3850_014975 [Lewinella sp. 4G2]